VWSIERRRFQWLWTSITKFQRHVIFWRWISYKRLKMRSYSYWNANRKPHPWFPIVQVWMPFNDLFKVTIIQRQITWKWYNTQLYLPWPTARKSYIIYRTAPYSMTLKDLYPSFKVTPFFDAEYLRNGTTYRHSSNEILIGTHTRPAQQCHFKWSWVTLTDLAKYSMTQSARGLSATAELLVFFRSERECVKDAFFPCVGKNIRRL